MKKIHFNSPEAATRKTIEGWVSNNGFFYGEDEHAARYAGSTHKKCSTCSAEIEKNRIYCEECLFERTREKFKAMPFKKWDFKEPLVIFDTDQYFFYAQDLNDYLYDNDLDPSDEEFVICVPQYAGEILPDEYYCDSLAEDTYVDDCSPELSKKFEELNKYIRENKIALSWVPGKFRTEVKKEDFE